MLVLSLETAVLGSCYIVQQQGLTSTPFDVFCDGAGSLIACPTLMDVRHASARTCSLEPDKVQKVGLATLAPCPSLSATVAVKALGTV